MRTSCLVAPLPDPTASIFLTTSYPFVTFPNTQCLPSRNEVSDVQMKNWLPLVSGPALAIERQPRPPWPRSKFSSSKVRPYIDIPPVPFSLVKSPPWHMKHHLG